MRGKWGSGVVGVWAVLSAAACAPKPAATIHTPTEGETIPGPTVTVALGVANVQLAPAADNQPGTAHHHLFLDVDPTPLGASIPQGEGITHLGGAQTAWRYDSLARGPHRLIAVLADPAHVPLPKGKADTVNFIVGPWP